MESKSAWARLESLFDQACALPREQQAGFVADQCADDPVLRAELEAMLRDSEQSTLALPDQTLASIIGRAAELDTPGGGSWTGRRIGPYQIVRQIGAGGMGAVFLAIRDDDQFRKEDALKTLRFEAPDDATLLRFRHERQILATLEHPNIARLLDGGATADGTPWLVMEYVDGKSLTEHATRANLTIEARIELFSLVCDAVQFAHQNLIIHRDIKPNNILVTEAGVPKLLDFGIAKLIDPATGETGSGPHTRTGLALMTPDYASPEQVRGGAVTTAVDIYALGAVLFELLTGKRPHDLKSYDPAEITKAICETGVRAPSRLGNTRLRGDLDNIVLKATHLDPLRRYRSAEQLAEDLRRYLKFLPVIARPDTFGYRARMYVRRNWLGLTALAAVVLALAIGLTAALWQARIARQRFELVRNLSHRFIFDFNDKLRQLPGSTDAREMLVNTALEYLDNLSKDAKGDTSLQWELAEAYEKVGDVQGSPVEPSLGHLAAALASYRKSIGLQEDLFRRGLLNRSRCDQMVHSYTQLSSAYRVAGPSADAVRAAERAVTIAGFGTPRARASALSYLSLAQLYAGEPQKALVSVTEASAAFTVEARSEPGTGPAHLRLASSKLAQGNTSVRLARLEESTAYFAEAIRLREEFQAAAPPDALNTRELILSYHRLADVLGGGDRFNLGRTDEADVLYRKALVLAENLSASDPKNVPARMEVARSAGKLGAAIGAARPAEALTLFQRALQLAEGSLPEGPDRNALRAAAYRSMSLSLARLGRLAEARAKLQESFRMDEAERAKHPASRSALTDLAEDWYTRGAVERAQSPRDAMEAWRRGLEFGERASALAPRDFAGAWLPLQCRTSMIALMEKSRDPELASQKQQLAAFWQKWDRAIPDASFIRSHLAAMR